MEDKIKLIEKMKADFENGLRPKAVAEKYDVTSHSVGGLAKLLGFSFATVKRDPRDWHAIGGVRKHIGFATLAFPEMKTMKSYRVKSVDAKTRTLTIEYQ